MADNQLTGSFEVGTYSPPDSNNLTATIIVDQGLVVGNPNGGDLGSGTVNCEAIYVGGTALGPERATYASQIVTSANALPLTSGSALDVATVNLPPGEWFIGGEVWFSVTGGTPNVQRIVGAISSVSATIPSEPDDATGVNGQEPQQTPQTGTGTGMVLPISGLYVNVTSETPYYLVAMASWTQTGTIVAYGKINGQMYPN